MIPPINSIEPLTKANGTLTMEGQRVLQAFKDILDAMGDVTAPTGGATVDTEARTAIAALIAAAGS